MNDKFRNILLIICIILLIAFMLFSLFLIQLSVIFGDFVSLGTMIITDILLAYIIQLLKEIIKSSKKDKNIFKNS